ncbi:MAG: class I SAM-dependent methyltransferase [Candidatus Eiseniibacteriota bacterium]
MRRVQLSVPLPDGVYGALRGIRRGMRGASEEALDLSGDRDVEWSWVAARIPEGPGSALDFGCGDSPLGIVAAERGFRVTGVDLGAVRWPYQHPRLTFVQGDILDLALPPASFDLVLNCSTVEHVGVPGRYGVTTERADGDLAAMKRLGSLLKPGGLMLVTVPVGTDAVFAPWHRVYGAARLPQLLDGFAVDVRAYWRKDPTNRWVESDEASALAAPSRERLYGLGCFVLRHA